MFTPSPKQIAASDHHIADMNSDPKLKTTVLRSVLASCARASCTCDGTLDGINGAGELGQDTVASGVGDPSAMFRNEAVHDLAMGGQGAERSDLILAHQARIACHVSREDRRQPSLDLVLLPIHRTLGAIPD